MARLVHSELYLPQGALAPHHNTAKIARSAHQSALVACPVTIANMTLTIMQTSATMLPVPIVMSRPYTIQPIALAFSSAAAQASERKCGKVTLHFSSYTFFA
jgi:hypothetical protein